MAAKWSLLLVLLAGAALASGAAGRADVVVRVRCAWRPEVAARSIVPPRPFVARVVSVRRHALPPFEAAGRGPQYKRLYLVTFKAIKGNAVLPSGHNYSQFAYVVRKTTNSRWCFLKGGSGP